ARSGNGRQYGDCPPLASISSPCAGSVPTMSYRNWCCRSRRSTDGRDSVAVSTVTWTLAFISLSSPSPTSPAQPSARAHCAPRPSSRRTFPPPPAAALPPTPPTPTAAEFLRFGIPPIVSGPGELDGLD